MKQLIAISALMPFLISCQKEITKPDTPAPHDEQVSVNWNKIIFNDIYTEQINQIILRRAQMRIVK